MGNQNKTQLQEQSNKKQPHKKKQLDVLHFIKSKQVSRILFLRNQIKKGLKNENGLNNQNRKTKNEQVKKPLSQNVIKQIELSKLLIQIPLLLTKYEICPNLSYIPNNYIILVQSKNLTIEYNFKKNKIQSNKMQNFSIVTDNSNFIQTTRDKIISTGGNFSDSMYIKYVNQEIKQFKMLIPRGFHRTTINQKKQKLFIIGGKQQKGMIRDCEIFDLREQNNHSKQKALSNLQYPIKAFGCSFCDNMESIFTFGGRRIIQQYFCITNSWIVCAEKLPTNVQFCSSIFIQQQEAVLIFDSRSQLQNTVLFDFKNCNSHGVMFPSRSFGQPWYHPYFYQNDMSVYMYSYNLAQIYKLFKYDLKKGDWISIVDDCLNK